MTVRAGRWAMGAAVLALVTLGQRGARAEGARRVVWVTSLVTPFGARVRAEIEDMGFEIEPAPVLPRRAAPPAVAAVRVVEDSPPRRVELWIAEAGSGEFVLRATVQPWQEGDEVTETVRAAEQLRALLEPLRERTPAHPLVVDVPPIPTGAEVSTAPVAPATPRRFAVSVSVAVPFQAGGPGVDLGLRGRWMATPVLGVGAFADIPLLGSTLKAAEGAASVSSFLFGGELIVAALPAGRVRVTASPGLAVAWLRTSGTASSPYRGRGVDAAVALPMIGVEVAPRIADRVRLCLDGHAGFSIPRTGIVFAGRAVATWGRPLGLLSAGVGVDF